MILRKKANHLLASCTTRKKVVPNVIAVSSYISSAHNDATLVTATGDPMQQDNIGCPVPEVEGVKTCIRDLPQY
jgi:hypothetical protein